MGKTLWLLPFIFFLGACTHGNCRAQKKDGEVAGTTPVATSGVTPARDSKSSAEVNVVSPKTERVKVYKADGSLQCGQGQVIPAAEMQKELKNIKVYSSANKNDGMMRIQVCGAPTGNSNVYEIDRKDLAAAIRMGFKEWTAD